MLPVDLPERLAFPIVSLPTYFDRDGRQDLESLRNTVDFCLDHELSTLLLTAGDSNYDLQTEPEIRAVARTVIEHTAGRGTVVVGTSPYWWRDQTLAFAKYVEHLGASAVMVCRPLVARGDSPGFEDPTFETYQAVAETVDCGIVLNGVFSMSLLRRLADLPSVVALKEDAGDAWCHDALYAVGRQLAVFGGGQKWRYLYGSLWGMVGYLTSYGPLAPEVTHRFWAAVQGRDHCTAAEIVDTYDNPFFEHAIGHAKGFFPVRQASFEVFGRGPRWLRSPQPSLDDAEMAALRKLFAEVGLL
ncbi:MAG: dihydrodipicolinate synthase family protein [Candidatus Latescibacterota bacterium]|nr:dihydrodipicolinate synthase family protein [Candidatus Latescibacterota bacterium]